MTEVCFLTALELGKSMIKVSARSVPGKGFLPGLQTATIPVSSHGGERERYGVSPSSYKGTSTTDSSDLI